MLSHPDADAFMRMYLTQPTDATTRLVFADWLEETGVPHNAAWAYFIRLRDEAERHDPDSRERRELDRQAAGYALKIRAALTIPAKLFVSYPRSLLQLLPAPKITVKLADFDVPLAVLDLMPESVARENLVLPLDVQGRMLLVAVADPNNCDTAQKLEFILNRDIVPVGADRDDMQTAIDRLYGQSETESVNEYLVEFATTETWTLGETQPPFDAPSDLDDNLSGIGDAPIVRVVNLIFIEAVNMRADRILFYPDLDALAVRYRIDGEWIERDRIPVRLLRPVTARIAVMATIDANHVFTEPPRAEPFTGEIAIQIPNARFRFRVTIQPSPDGPTTQIDITREPVAGA